MNVYFPPELLKQIADLADRKKLSRSAIVEAAVASFLAQTGRKPLLSGVSTGYRGKFSG